MHFWLDVVDEVKQSLHHNLLVLLNVGVQLCQLRLSLFVHLLGKVVLGAGRFLLLLLELGFPLPPVVLDLPAGFLLGLLQPLGFSWQRGRGWEPERERERGRERERERERERVHVREELGGFNQWLVASIRRQVG